MRCWKLPKGTPPAPDNRRPQVTHPSGSTSPLPVSPINGQNNEANTKTAVDKFITLFYLENTSPSQNQTLLSELGQFNPDLQTLFQTISKQPTTNSVSSLDYSTDPNDCLGKKDIKALLDMYLFSLRAPTSTRVSTCSIESESVSSLDYSTDSDPLTNESIINILKQEKQPLLSRIEVNTICLG